MKLADQIAASKKHAADRTGRPGPEKQLAGKLEREKTENQQVANTGVRVKK